MPSIIQPPIPLEHDVLLAIVLGKDKRFPRQAALSLYRRSGAEDRVEIFHRLLVDEEENPRIRYLAATNLWLLGSEKAGNALKDAGQQARDAKTLTAIVKGLGRIGDQEALEVVSRIKRDAGGLLARQAGFAEILLAHRFGLEGHDLPMPEKFQALPRRGTVKVRAGEPDEQEKKLCLETLAADPYGIPLSSSSQVCIDCAGQRWMLVLNSTFDKRGGMERLAGKKALFGILATKNPETERYSGAFLIFTSPVKRNGRVYIILTRPGGEPCFAGTARAEGRDEAKFTIRSVEWPGVFPMKAEGHFRRDGRFELRSVTAGTRTTSKRQPAPSRKPAEVM